MTARPHATGVMPPWREVGLTQLRTVWLASRRELAIVGGVLLFMALPMVTRHVTTEGASSDMQFPDVMWLAVLVGLVAPMAVWRGDSMGRRAYFWTMPVERFRHTLVRVTSGWVWLMITVGVILGWAVALATVTGGELSMHDTRILLRELPEGAVPTAADYVIRRWPVAGWQWLVPFTAATAMYLLASGVVVSSDRPWRWFALVAFAAVVVHIADVPWGQRATESLVYGRHGLLLLATGATPHAVEIHGPGGERVRVLALVASLEPWLRAVALWLCPGAAAVVAAAYRVRET